MGSVPRAAAGRPDRPCPLRRQVLRGLLFGALLASGCASAAIRQQDQAELMRAERLTRQGCYDCLTEARDIYVRDRHTQPGCAGAVRITTGLVAHTRQCIEAMEEVLPRAFARRARAC